MIYPPNRNLKTKYYDSIDIQQTEFDDVLDQIVEAAREELFMMDHSKEILRFMKEEYPEELMGLVRDVGGDGIFSSDTHRKIDWDRIFNESQESVLMDKLTKKYRKEVLGFLKDKYPEEFI